MFIISTFTFSPTHLRVYPPAPIRRKGLFACYNFFKLLRHFYTMIKTLLVRRLEAGRQDRGHRPEEDQTCPAGMAIYPPVSENGK